MATTHGTLAPIRGPQDVQPEWLTQVLTAAGFDGVVGSTAYAPVGTGQIADSYRITVDYLTGHGPTTLIGKFASEDVSSARLGGAGGLYEREVLFYRELAPHLQVRTARPYAALLGDDHAFTLLLEDLAPARTADQLAGCTLAEARLAVLQAAALHAGSWRAPHLAAEPRMRTMIDGLLHMTGRLPRILERLAGSDVLPHEQLQAAAELARQQGAWARVLERRTALWHQDFRLDNLLFTGDGDDLGVAVLDWQTVCFGPSVGDLSLLLGTGLTTTDRRQHEQQLVGTYHRRLVELGVADYSLDECWDGYRLMAVHGVFAGLVGAGGVKRTERGDRMWRTWIDRHLTQAEDLGAWELLRRA